MLLDYQMGPYGVSIFQYLSTLDYFSLASEVSFLYIYNLRGGCFASLGTPITRLDFIMGHIQCLSKLSDLKNLSSELLT